MSEENTSVDDSIASATSAYEFPKRPATSLIVTRPTFVNKPAWAARIPSLSCDTRAILLAGAGRCQSQLAGNLLHRLDAEINVFVEVDAQVGGAVRDVFPLDGGRERGLFHFLADTLGI